MASFYTTETLPLDIADLIPIYYKVPFDSGYEIISGYLEKIKLPKGTDHKRFYGHFQCENCSNQWQSGNAWQGYKQDCKNCGISNWPLKVYHLEQSVDPLDGKPHKSELCGKCQELGYNCRTGAELAHNWKLSPTKKITQASKYNVCFNKQFELLKYHIMIEPNFIRDLYKALWHSLSPTEEIDFIQGLRNARKEWEIKGKHDLVEVCEDILDEISN